MSKSSLRFVSTGFAAVLVAAMAVTSGSAQSSDPSAHTAKSKHATTSRAPSKATKPIPREALRTVPEQQWTIENALPDHSASMRQYDVPPQPKIGRVPLHSGPGTVGLETDTRTNPYKTPDGRTIPGLEATDSRSNSYVGLSLSVPTNNNAMNIPLPLEPLWGRP